MSDSSWPSQAKHRPLPNEPHQRSREVISTSGGIVRCKFPSRKARRMIHCEGLLELDAALLFEASPKVHQFREQPDHIAYADGDRIRRYTPDFELLLESGETVWIEVKPTRSMLDKKVHHKLSMVAAHMERQGKPFVILTEEDLRLEPRQSNIKKVINRARRSAVNVSHALIALRRCAEQLPAPMCRTEVLLSKFNLEPYGLLLAGVLTCDLSAPLSSDTLIHLAEGANHEWFRVSEEYEF